MPLMRFEEDGALPLRSSCPLPLTLVELRGNVKQILPEEHSSSEEHPKQCQRAVAGRSPCQLKVIGDPAVQSGQKRRPNLHSSE